MWNFSGKKQQQKDPKQSKGGVTIQRKPGMMDFESIRNFEIPILLQDGTTSLVSLIKSIRIIHREL